MSEPEPLGTKVFLLFLDKVLLGAALAFLGYFLGLKSDRAKTIGDYQKILFDSRVDSYVEVLRKARQVEDAFLLSYCAAQPCPDDSLKLHGRLSSISGRMRKIDDLIQSAKTGGGSDSWTTFEDDLNGRLGELRNQTSVLQELGSARRERSLYLTDNVARSTDRFISAVVTAVEEDLAKTEKCAQAVAVVWTCTRRSSCDAQVFAAAEGACGGSPSGSAQTVVSREYENLAATINAELHLRGINLGE